MPATSTAWIFYDHETRPIQIVDYNLTTGSGKRVQDLYWDVNDRLITRIDTPDTGSPGDYTVELHGYVGDYVVTTDMRRYVADSLAEEKLYYTMRSQVGLPTVRYEARGWYDTAEVWRAESWSPHGELLEESGDPTLRPLWRFFGQIALEGSSAEAWLGGEIVESRPEVYLNRWRVYDPQVGQYTSPEPRQLEGQLSLHGLGPPGAQADRIVSPAAMTHPYNYALLNPVRWFDPDGAIPECWRNIRDPYCFEKCTSLCSRDRCFFVEEQCLRAAGVNSSDKCIDPRLADAARRECVAAAKKCRELTAPDRRARGAANECINFCDDRCTPACI